MSSRGGKRQGSGRKKGQATQKIRTITENAAAEGITPLEYMLKIMRDESVPREERFEAAKSAAPYIHPRLAAVEHTGKEGGNIEVSVVRRIIIDNNNPDAKGL